MKRTSVAHLNHGIADALEVVGEWWTLLVVWAIREEAHQFEAMQKKLGIARNILSDRLMTLVDAGVVEKRVYSQKPPRHEYHLTDMGKDLHGVLTELEKWGKNWRGGGGTPASVRVP
jgi:DNA-binding HxlR family transcriptional regulator